ncbi:MAG: sigma-70 family RNA polymerase sigma factor [Bacteroidetes bacterium]|nr:sigma-70 family RNA polymerase sigma factor [Bacteroidota bacterium]
MREIVPQLFRTEFRKIVAVLSKRFGLEHIEIAEDICSETFLLAAETWGKKGIPENPTAWLYTVAKNKTLDYLKRNQHFREKVSQALKNNPDSESSVLDIDLHQENAKDSELSMLFAICHPAIPEEAQIGLALRILFGLGIDEISDAFLSNKETVNKRLHRAKEKLREENIRMEMPVAGEIAGRLSAVLRILYLLFNAGYYAPAKNSVIRKEICLQALQLAYLLSEFKSTHTPAVDALIALMCFHASRFEARLQDNALVLLDEQDRSLWDQQLIQTGERYLNQSATGASYTKYHLEAAIAYWHTRENTHPDKWPHILKYYNLLLQIEYSPVAALNRTYALFKNEGPEVALAEARKLALDDQHLYHALMGQLCLGIDEDASVRHFRQAMALSKSDSEKQLLQKKIDALLSRNR